MTRETGLEIHGSTFFTWLEYAVHWVGIAVLAALVIMTGRGAFGRGGEHDALAGKPADAIWVRYERHPRWETRTIVEVHALPGGPDKTARVSVNGAYLDRMGLRGVRPEPESVEAGSDATVFVFPGAGRDEHAVIRFEFEPEKPGAALAALRLESGGDVAFTQKVYP